MRNCPEKIIDYIISAQHGVIIDKKEHCKKFLLIMPVGKGVEKFYLLLKFYKENGVINKSIIGFKRDKIKSISDYTDSLCLDRAIEKEYDYNNFSNFILTCQKKQVKIT